MHWLWVIYILLIEVPRNYYIIEVQKTRPDYLQSFIIRGMVAIIHGAVWLDSNGVHDVSSLSVKELLLLWWPILSFQLASFFVLFPVLLNIFRNKKWNYRGKNSGFFSRLPNWIYWSIYVTCLIYLIVYGTSLYF